MVFIRISTIRLFYQQLKSQHNYKFSDISFQYHQQDNSLILIILAESNTMNISEMQNSNSKIRTLEDQYIAHSLAAHSFIQILHSYKSIQIHRSNQIQQLLPTLDSIKSPFYKDLAAKLATYFDTCIFQIKHMLTDLQDNLKDYLNFKELIQTRFSSLMREFKKNRNYVLSNLKSVYQTINRSTSQPTKQQVTAYNVSLSQYEVANTEIIKFRKQYQAKMMSEATDHLMKFFVLQLQRLRNNQFDIDQILKREDGKGDYYKLLKINEQIFWQSIQVGPLEQRISTEYEINKLNQIVEIIWKGKLQPEHQIFNLFSQVAVNSNIQKLPALLKNPDYQSILKTVLFSFKNQKLLVKDFVFKKIYQIIRPIIQHGVVSFKFDMIDATAIFSSSIFTQRIISSDEGLQICQVVCLFDYVKQFQFCREMYWNGVYEQIMKMGQQQRELALEIWRKITKRLGVVTVEQRQKRRIFGRNSLQMTG